MDTAGDVVTETVTRIRHGAQTGTDAFNVPIYGPDIETDITGALVAPGGSTEVITTAGRVPVVTPTTVYFRDAWPDIVPTDRLRVRGVVYDVAGKPADWRSDGPGGLVVPLRDAEG